MKEESHRWQQVGQQPAGAGSGQRRAGRWVSMPGAGAVVQGRQTLGMADENEGGGGFAPVGITHHLGVVGRGAVDGREKQVIAFAGQRG